jgi:hypothetical protein
MTFWFGCVFWENVDIDCCQFCYRDCLDESTSGQRKRGSLIKVFGVLSKILVNFIFLFLKTPLTIESSQNTT